MVIRCRKASGAKSKCAAANSMPFSVSRATGPRMKAAVWRSSQPRNTISSAAAAGTSRATAASAYAARPAKCGETARIGAGLPLGAISRSNSSSNPMSTKFSTSPAASRRQRMTLAALT